METTPHHAGTQTQAPWRQALTDEEISALPPVVGLATAARILGLTPSAAQQLARRGAWPTPVIRLGRTYRVPTEPILALTEMGSGPPIERTPQGSDVSARHLPWHDRHDMAGGL